MEIERSTTKHGKFRKTYSKSRIFNGTRMIKYGTKFLLEFGLIIF